MARRNSILVSKTLYQIGVVSVIAAVMWVAVGIYFATVKDFKIDVDKNILEPLNPTLDQAVVQSLTGRLKLERDLTAIPESSISSTLNDTIEVDGTR